MYQITKRKRIALKTLGVFMDWESTRKEFGERKKGVLRLLICSDQIHCCTSEKATTLMEIIHLLQRC
jgi:hypothetical protein